MSYVISIRSRRLIWLALVIFAGSGLYALQQVVPGGSLAGNVYTMVGLGYLALSSKFRISADEEVLNITLGMGVFVIFWPFFAILS